MVATCVGKSQIRILESYVSSFSLKAQLLPLSAQASRSVGNLSPLHASISGQDPPKFCMKVRRLLRQAHISTQVKAVDEVSGLYDIQVSGLLGLWVIRLWGE